MKKSINLFTSRIVLLTIVLFLSVTSSHAADYIFGSSLQQMDNLPPGCSGSGATYFCTGAIALADGDNITIGSPTTITIAAEFSSAGNNEINIDGTPSDLTLNVTGAISLGANTTINANITSAVAVDLGTNNNLSGSITTIAGAITIGADGSVTGNMTTTTGAITIGDRGSITGDMTSSSGAFLIGTGGVINGNMITAVAGAIKTEANVIVNGTITTFGGAITIGADGNVTGDIASTDAGAIVVGESSAVLGNLTSYSGAVTVGTMATITGNVISEYAGALTVGAGAIVNGSVGTIDSGAITIGANAQVTDVYATLTFPITLGTMSQVGAVCCKMTQDDSCVTYTAPSYNPVPSICTVEPSEQCGIFPSVLTTYDSITSTGNNDQACYTGSISYPLDEMTGAISCNSTGCGGDVPCTRTDPPTVYYTATFPTMLSTTTAISSDTTYTPTDGNYNIAGSVVVTGGTTLTFAPGDYYFTSLKFMDNNPSIVLSSGGPVRIFIQNNLTVEKNGLNINSNGSPDNLFVYVGGDMDFLTNGNVKDLKGYFYVKGSVLFDANSNNFKVTGGITAEGPISITGNNGNFLQSGDASSLGFGACEGGTSSPILGSFDAWESSITNRQITTKIVNKPFTLIIASLNSDGNALETKTGITAQYQLYDYSTNTSVTGFQDFDADTNSTLAKIYVVTPNAYKDVRVRFKYCKDANASDNIVPYINCQQEVTGYSFEYDVASTDNFSIRPDSFVLTVPSGENINLLTSAKVYSFPLTAKQYGEATATTGYTITDANTALSLSKIMYQPTDAEDNSLNGTLAFSAFNITDGIGNALINFTDVGKVNIQLKDTTWAQVDTDNGDTVADCSSTGAYICGDINATFIPDHFQLSAVTLNNTNDGNFTYLSNDLNMSAHMGLTITAENKANGTTQNFKAGSWENPVDINLAVATIGTPVLNKDDINETQNLAFILGARNIPSTETNASKKLMFNFNRAKDNPLNPFIVNGADVNLTATSLYTSSSGATASIVGSSVANQNATFVYGRTHASRQRYQVLNGGPATGTANIYYESYCFLTDASGVGCTKNLINSFSSTNTDDIRWFINTAHTNTDGNPGTVDEKDSLVQVTAAAVNTATNPNTVVLTYNGTDYPYKTTMENNASSWLIYNEDDSTAPRNKFSVEFYKAATGWSGEHETNTTTNDPETATTNRRSMW